MATVDRAALTTWLTKWRGAVATAAGLAVTDTDDGWGPALDEVDAANALHLNLADIWIEPLADYWGLRLLANTLDVRFDLMTSGDNLKLGQVADRVRAQLDKAEAKVWWLIPGRAVAAVPYAGGLTVDDVDTRAEDPDAEPPIFTRRTGPPLTGMSGTRWTRYWP